MDEPVNSLDLQKQLELCQLLEKVKEKEKVDIILILHDINLACRYADHVVIIDENGQPFSSGLIHEVITEEMLEKVYGVKAEVNYDKRGVLLSPSLNMRTVNISFINIDAEPVRACINRKLI